MTVKICSLTKVYYLTWTQAQVNKRECYNFTLQIENIETFTQFSSPGNNQIGPMFEIPQLNSNYCAPGFSKWNYISVTIIPISHIEQCDKFASKCEFMLQYWHAYECSDISLCVRQFVIVITR